MHLWRHNRICMSHQERTRDLQRQFNALGKRIAAGDESELLLWIIPAQLAGCHRPLRYNTLYGGSARSLDVRATPLVMQWASRMRASGIRSIMCLMSDEEVAFYSKLDLGAPNLLAFYVKQGFCVASVPWKDPAHVRTDPTALRAKERAVCDKALIEFDALPKPVLLHCSAGVDRSSPVAQHIRQHRTGDA